MGTPILAITDGTTKVNLLTKTGAGINTCEYTPSRQIFKNDGIWADSSVSDGRQLQMRKWTNIIDVLSLVISGDSQDSVIENARRLTALLEKAVQYWTTEWQNEPVWLERRGSNETNTSYTLIHGYKWANDDNPFAPPFYVAEKPFSMKDIDLALEHGPWLANAPDDSECVKISNMMPGLQESDSSSPTANNDDAYITDNATELEQITISQENDDGYARHLTTDMVLSDILTVGYLGGAPAAQVDIVLRFLDIDIPNGATIISATIEFGGFFSETNKHMAMTIWGELNNTPATFSTWANYVGRVRTAANTAWDDWFTYEYNDPVYTSNFSDIVQEIVNLPGWNSGDDMAFFIEPDGSTITTLTFNSFTPPSAYPPVLNISYEIADTIYLTKTYLRVAKPVQGTINTGIRFINVAVPKDAQIQQAYLTLTNTRATINEDFVMKIIGEDSAAPAIFGTWADFTGRSQTNADKQWNAEDWSFGSVVNSPDISNIIQEIVNKAAWASGNNMVIFLEGDSGFGECRFASFENTTHAAPELVIYYTEDNYVGRAKTCANEVYVANKNNSKQLDRMFYHDPGGIPPFVDLGAIIPFDLLPNPMAVGDCIYFGANKPFSSLVFDFAINTGTATLLWEYSDGGTGWPDLTIHTDIPELSEFTGVGFVGWIQPQSNIGGYAVDWAQELVNGSTLYWVRARVLALGASPKTPRQQNRNIYTITRNSIDVEILSGDITSIAKTFILHTNAADDNPSKAIVAIRSVDRGESFVPHINAVEQNHGSISCSLGAATTSMAAPTGSVRRYAVAANMPWTTTWTIEIDSPLNIEYYGRYRAFARGYYDETGGGSLLDEGDFSSRLTISMGVEDISKVSENIEIREDFWYFDYGIVTIPPATLPSIYIGKVTIDVELRNNTADTFDFDWIDLILVPIDEYAMEYNQNPTSNEGDLTILDSLSYIGKRDVFSVLRKLSDYEIYDIPSVISPGPIQLQSNVNQRVYFFILEDCIYEWVGKIQMWHNARYLTFRGDR